MIAVVDYGMGNLRSVAKALEAVGLDPVVTDRPRKIADARAVVLPGVGAFGDCMKNLRERGLIGPVLAAIRSGKPYLGLCLGLQILFDESEEFGRRKGLGLIPGRVVRFRDDLPDGGGGTLKVPHMGWNAVAPKRGAALFKGVPKNSHFYFVHSYYAVCDDPAHVLATSEYGTRFTVAVRRDNIVACQFHPEKSQALGLRLLANFGRLVA
jgi:glutamine amidotransferase